MQPYASRTGTQANLSRLRRHGWGLLISASGVVRDEGFDLVAIDNGAWAAHMATQKTGIQQILDLDRFYDAVSMFGHKASWVAAPDIVQGGKESLSLSLEHLDRLLGLTDRVLIPVQDGMQPRDLEPYLSVRVGIFLGGSTEYKLGSMRGWGALCREHGCYFHVARVNTARRISLCASCGADSFDGTSATMFGSTILMLDNARRQKSFLF